MDANLPWLENTTLLDLEQKRLWTRYNFSRPTRPRELFAPTLAPLRPPFKATVKLRSAIHGNEQPPLMFTRVLIAENPGCANSAVGSVTNPSSAVKVILRSSQRSRPPANCFSVWTGGGNKECFSGTTIKHSKRLKAESSTAIKRSDNLKFASLKSDAIVRASVQLTTSEFIHCHSSFQ